MISMAFMSLGKNKAMKHIPEIRGRIPATIYGRLFRVIAYSLAPAAMGGVGLYRGIQIDRLTGMAPNFTLICLITGLDLGYMGFVHEIKGNMKA